MTMAGRAPRRSCDAVNRTHVPPFKTGGTFNSSQVRRPVTAMRANVTVTCCGAQS